MLLHIGKLFSFDKIPHTIAFFVYKPVTACFWCSFPLKHDLLVYELLNFFLKATIVHQKKFLFSS